MQPRGHETARSGRNARRAAVVATVLAACGLAVPAAGRAATWPFPGGAHPVVTVLGDAVIASGLAPGRTTLMATRPDAVTGEPVAIGKFVATASPFSPFTVNTGALLAPTGDCWQKGALKSAVTPDLQPGDTLTFTGLTLYGSAPTTSVTVGAPARGTRPGPVPLCASLAPWARNAVIGAPGSASGPSVELSGVAQPFATSVSLTASDGSATTDPVAATPDAGGKWSATLPLGTLASGTIAVTPVFTVPDVSNGDSVRIAGAKVTLTKG
jgi:hypothetical protein